MLSDEDIERLFREHDKDKKTPDEIKRPKNPFWEMVWEFLNAYTRR